MRIADALPPIETALDLEPEEMALFVLRHVSDRPHGQLNRFNYLNGTDPDLVSYAGGHREVLLQRLAEAWAWLERELFLAQQPGAHDGFMFITRRGRRVLEGVDFGSYAKAELLRTEALDPILARQVRPEFLRGDYDSAVFKAFKEVEVRVRHKAGLSDSDIGVALMRRAFGPNGALVDPGAEPAEQKAEADLFAGAVGRFKNPGSHRNVDFSNPEEVADIVRFANQLLRIVDRRTAAPGPSNVS